MSIQTRGGVVNARALRLQLLGPFRPLCFFPGQGRAVVCETDETEESQNTEDQQIRRVGGEVQKTVKKSSSGLPLQVPQLNGGVQGRCAGEVDDEQSSKRTNSPAPKRLRLLHIRSPQVDYVLG
ncbi:hypothetical protein Mapa_003021 [Marchantia paleacea]|nr:hypothetical protein Mapa_003021 [Marchantia paleacea]